MAKNYLLRLIGANLLAGVFAPSASVWWVDLLAHFLVALALTLLTSPETDR